MAEKVKSINLLPKKGEGIVNQFLAWALTIGRLLIILTETLALSVFLYRFSLDVKIVDLHDQIKQQSSIVQQFRGTENTARNLQSRLVLAKEHNASSTITPDVFSDIIEMGRGEITFRNLVVGTESVKIDVQASRSNSLNSFINKLKKYPNLTAVSIESVENRTTSAYIKMNIRAKLKTAGQHAASPDGKTNETSKIQL